MGSRYRVKLKDKWSTRAEELVIYRSGNYSDMWQVAPYWDEIYKYDFTILHGFYHTPAQFKIEIDSDFDTKKLTFDELSSQILYEGKEFTLIEQEKWVFDDSPRWDFNEGYFGDNRLIYIFKKDRKGFPCKLTEVK